MNYSLETVVAHESYKDAAEVLDTVLTACPRLQSLLVRVREAEPEVPLGFVASELRRRDDHAMHLRVDEGMISFNNLGGCAIGRFDVRSLVTDLADAEDWLRGIAKDDRFVQARLYEPDYDYWQNAEDPLQFRSAGRSMEGLPIVSNGLPPPVDQMVVDISRNPGRWTLRDGYIESIGAVMWLTPRFFEVAGCCKSDLFVHSWIRLTELNGVTRLEVEGGHFDSPIGTQAERQNALRALLFPHAA